MIPTIIYLLLRRYRRSNPEVSARIILHANKISRIILILMLLLLTSLFVPAQQTKHEYIVMHKGSQVGTMTLLRQQAGARTTLKMESKIKAKLLFTFTAKAIEEVVFENGIMIRSYVYRKMNGTEKLNQETRLSTNTYIISRGNEQQRLDKYPIHYSMICLYLQEPVGINKIYSDNLQRFLAIIPLGSNEYRIDFPGGNFNEYFYRDGKCVRIEIHHKFYRSTIQLKTR
jgi:hypothetical protein